MNSQVEDLFTNLILKSLVTIFRRPYRFNDTKSRKSNKMKHEPCHRTSTLDPLTLKEPNLKLLLTMSSAVDLSTGVFSICGYFN